MRSRDCFRLFCRDVVNIILLPPTHRKFYLLEIRVLRNQTETGIRNVCSRPIYEKWAKFLADEIGERRGASVTTSDGYRPYELLVPPTRPGDVCAHQRETFLYNLLELDGVRPTFLDSLLHLNLARFIVYNVNLCTIGFGRFF